MAKTQTVKFDLDGEILEEIVVLIDDENRPNSMLQIRDIENRIITEHGKRPKLIFVMTQRDDRSIYKFD